MLSAIYILHGQYLFNSLFNSHPKLQFFVWASFHVPEQLRAVRCPKHEFPIGIMVFNVEHKVNVYVIQGLSLLNAILDKSYFYHLFLSFFPTENWTQIQKKNPFIFFYFNINNTNFR